jgi:hypothetical protein
MPFSLNCPTDDQYDKGCKHHVGVTMRTPLRQASADHALEYDGKTQAEGAQIHYVANSDTDLSVDCDRDGLGGVPCWPCV